MKTIFVLGKTKEQAAEYIQTHIRIITNEYQLKGCTDTQAVLVLLPQQNVVKEALSRGIKVIEA